MFDGAFLTLFDRFKVVQNSHVTLDDSFMFHEINFLL